MFSLVTIFNILFFSIIPCLIIASFVAIIENIDNYE